MIANNTAIATIAIHAPARNLVTTTTTSTPPVHKQPMVLITRDRIILRRVAGSFSILRKRVSAAPSRAGSG